MEPEFDLPSLDSVLNRRNVHLNIGSPQTFLATHQRLEQATGLTTANRSFGPREVFGLLLDEQIVFTRNARRMPQRTFPTTLLSSDTVDLDDGAMLALYLFRLQNGPGSERERYRVIEDTFRSLTGRSFRVTPSADQPNAGEIDLAIWIIEGSREVPYEFGGAGIGEALLISATMTAASKVVFLDEPALNLPPCRPGAPCS